MVATAASASTQFLGVDWGAIALVFVVALVAVAVIVSFYSLGLRLLAVGEPHQRPVRATIGGFACIGVGVVAVLYGIYLVIPILH